MRGRIKDKSGKRIILFILMLFIFFTSTGCSSKNKAKITFNPQDPFSIEQFQSEMKAKKINFKIEDAENDILPWRTYLEKGLQVTKPHFIKLFKVLFSNF